MLVFVGCTPTHSELEEALSLSGDNRKELEYVLAHYSKSKSDSVKWKAAVFLIKNMPGHYTLTNTSVSHNINEIDSLYPDLSNIMKKTVYNIPLRNQYGFRDLKKIEDIKIIESEYLIEHIDNAVQMWDSCFWLQQLSFDDFCEYILPYRTANEPLLKNDSTLYLWKTVLNSLNYYNYIPNSMLDIKSLQRNLLGRSDDIYFRGMKIPSLFNYDYKFECLDICYYNLTRLRAVGIPSFIDFIPAWPYRNGKHYWHVVVDPVYANENNSDMQNSRTAKVYRLTYSHNPSPIPNGMDSIPLLFKTPFMKDVTRQYIKVSNVVIELKKIPEPEPLYLYLSIFNNLEWKPMAWSNVKGGKAVFKDMGRGIIYLPVFYKGEEERSASFPFLLDMDGRMINLIPDKKNLIDLKITRKYPLDNLKLDWGESLKGCYIEASNHPDFRDADTLFITTVADPNLNYSTIKFENSAFYRYWRISKPEGMLNIGDWQLFDNEFRNITGKAMAANDNDKSVINAFDNDMLTYSNSYPWLGIDLGKKVNVKMMKYVPRTDANGIIPGHYYELLYYDEEGWKTVGIKQATGQMIEFESVPQGALYWLKNNTEGKEERIFTYEHGRVVFW